MDIEQNWEPLVYTETFKVSPEMIDDNHHFNNVWSVQWIQDISKNHSEQCRYPHPEHCARTAYRDGGGNAGEIAGPYAACK